eukprot:CAMPEP_0175013176 /NCGR_PEP_ID=MMETSP0005-20121125/9759_1 /TAXON_ID=420556 /ORGANISM="Ochromonas sp., Strain CCMP1393" /LENGTH=293 /DNA_ID=CAMNT_0016269575 /DNA_START=113 /DNA_END=994 /DNA_ORIENTATION=-
MDVYQISPSRHTDNQELNIRFDILGHRFVRDYFEKKIYYFGENPQAVFRDLSSLGKDRPILVLVSCHGSKSRNGAFLDVRYPETKQYVWWNAKALFDCFEFEYERNNYNEKTIVFLFAQCYGGLMAKLFRKLINDWKKRRLLIKKFTKVEVHSLSDGETHRLALEKGKVLGLQSLHKEFTAWVFDRFGYPNEKMYRKLLEGDGVKRPSNQAVSFLNSLNPSTNSSSLLNSNDDIDQGEDPALEEMDKGEIEDLSFEEPLDHHHHHHHHHHHLPFVMAGVVTAAAVYWYWYWYC